MKKSLVAGGLAGIVLACLPLSSQAQKRQYLNGNVHDVKYTHTTEKDFPKYKLEEQCLFNNCYTFWNYNPRQGELNFWVSKKDEESMTFQEGTQVKIDAPMYIPTKIMDKINITSMTLERTSFEKLKRRAKEIQDFGFSVDITDKDLNFKLPEIKVKGISYIVLNEILDNSEERADLPLYLIPKTKGTKIFFPSQSFIQEDGYPVQAVVECDEKGGVFQPVPFNESGRLYVYNPSDYNSGIPEKQEKLKKQKSEKQDISKKTDYIKYREELEKETQTLYAPTKEEEIQEYEIKTGDTFYNIANKIYGTGKDAYWIQKANPEVDPSKLKVGQKIKILKK